MELFVYPAIIEKGESWFWARFTDLDGYISGGATVEEVRDNASEALSLHLIGMIEDNIDLPEPTPIEDVKVDENEVKFLISFIH